MLDEAFDLFAKAAPASVMIRGVLENILSANTAGLRSSRMPQECNTPGNWLSPR